MTDLLKDLSLNFFLNLIFDDLRPLGVLIKLLPINVVLLDKSFVVNLLLHEVVSILHLLFDKLLLLVMF